MNDYSGKPTNNSKFRFQPPNKKNSSSNTPLNSSGSQMNPSLLRLRQQNYNQVKFTTTNDDMDTLLRLLDDYVKGSSQRRNSRSRQGSRQHDSRERQSRNSFNTQNTFKSKFNLNSGGFNTDDLQSSSKFYFSSSNSNQQNFQGNQQKVPKSTYYRNNQNGSGSNNSLMSANRRFDGSMASSSHLKTSHIQERHVREIQGAYENAGRTNQGLSIPSVSNTYNTYTTKGGARNLTYQFFHNNTSLQEFEDQEGLRIENLEDEEGLQKDPRRIQNR